MVQEFRAVFSPTNSSELFILWLLLDCKIELHMPPNPDANHQNRALILRIEPMCSPKRSRMPQNPVPSRCFRVLFSLLRHCRTLELSQKSRDISNQGQIGSHPAKSASAAWAEHLFGQIKVFPTRSSSTGYSSKFGRSKVKEVRRACGGRGKKRTYPTAALIGNMRGGRPMCRGCGAAHHCSCLQT